LIGSTVLTASICAVGGEGVALQRARRACAAAAMIAPFNLKLSAITTKGALKTRPFYGR
jgi:hypothetical protein